MAKQEHPRLKLTFSGTLRPKLDQTDFSSSPQSEPLIARRGASEQFTWTAGVKALCLFFLHYLTDFKANRDNRQPFVYDGDREDPAKSLDDALGQRPEKKGGKTWMAHMFGVHPSGKTTCLSEYITRLNPGQEDPTEPFQLALEIALFPQESVEVFVKTRKITDRKELLGLAGQIEEQWLLEPRRTKAHVEAASIPPAPAPSASHRVTSTSGERAPSVPCIERAQPTRLAGTAPSITGSEPAAPGTNRSSAGAREDSILPFVLVSPSLDFFRKPDQDPHLVSRPTYNEVFEDTTPVLSGLQPDVQARLGIPRCAIISGPEGCGKTTLALRFAAHFSREGSTPLYLDLAYPLTNFLANRAADVVASLAHYAYCFVIDNVQCVDKWTWLYRPWRCHLGPSQLIVVKLNRDLPSIRYLRRA